MTTTNESVLWRCEVAVEHGYYVLGQSTEIKDDATPAIGAVAAGPGLMVPADNYALDVEVELVLDPDVAARPHWIAEFDEDASLTSWEGGEALPASTAILGAGRWAIEQEVLPPPNSETARHVLRVAPLDDNSRRWLDQNRAAQEQALARVEAEPAPFGGGVVENLTGTYLLTWSTDTELATPGASRTVVGPTAVRLRRDRSSITIEHPGRDERWILVAGKPQPSGDKWLPALSLQIPAGAPLRALTADGRTVPGLPETLEVGPAGLTVFFSNPIDDYGAPRPVTPGEPTKLRIDIINPRRD